MKRISVKNWLFTFVVLIQISKTIEYVGRWLSFIPKSVSIGLVAVFCVGTGLMLAFLGPKRGLRWSAGLALLEYLFLLLFLAVLRRKVQDFHECGLIPFASYRPVLDGTRPVSAQVVANVLAFVPVGLLLGCVFGRMKWWKVLLIGGGVSLVIEVLQYVFKRGYAEFDDVFHNALGCLIGYGVYVGIARLWTVLRQAQEPPITK